MANPAVLPALYPGNGTVVLLTTEIPPRSFVFPLAGKPPDLSDALSAGFQKIADAISAQTLALVADDAKFLAVQTVPPKAVA